ncbi:MAG: hypothetical protein AAFN80_16950, partial [Pseudomonadota bacterium]
MKQKLLTAIAATMMAASPALADLVIVDTSYRTGPYAANGIPFSDGYQDYFTLGRLIALHTLFSVVTCLAFHNAHGLTT